MRFIVTVPHAACPPRWVPHEGGHPCDLFAENAGRQLQKSLTANGHDARLFVADVPRTAVDMNRSASAGTPWRQRIDVAMAERAPEPPSYLLDAHSFPRASDWGTSSDFVIMGFERIEGWHRALGMRVAESARVRLGYAVGSSANDLMASATARGVPCVLLEFCEDLGETTLKEICDSVARVF